MPFHESFALRNRRKSILPRQLIAAFDVLDRESYPVHMYSDNASTFKSASRI